MLVAVISDTHLPKRSRRLPARCLELIAAADAVIHAGDVAATKALREIEAASSALYAVHGNVDEPALQRELPATREVRLGERRLAIIHDAGPAQGRLRRLRGRFPQADAVVFGHSHLPLHEHAGGFQIFNPGSPTERRRAPQRSMGLLRIGSSGLSFEHVWLGRRDQ